MSKISKAPPPKFTKIYMNWEQLPLIMTLEEACCLIRASDVTVRKYITEGKIRGVKCGNGWRIERDSIKKLFFSDDEQQL